MEEGLLLDGVAVETRDVAVGRVEGAVAAKSDLADAGESGGGGAAVAAGEAADAVGFEGFDEGGLGGAGGELVGEGGHGGARFYCRASGGWMVCLGSR